MRAQAQQLRDPLDRSGAVEDHVPVDRVLQPFGQVGQGERETLQADEILDDEARGLDLVAKLVGPVAVPGEPPGQLVVQPPALLRELHETVEERSLLVEAFRQVAVQARGPPRDRADEHGRAGRATRSASRRASTR